jgi:hypothetical protein
LVRNGSKRDAAPAQAGPAVELLERNKYPMESTGGRHTNVGACVARAALEEDD